MLTLNIGPLALAMQHVLIIGSLLLASLTGWRVGRRQGLNPEKQLFGLLITALLAARVAFVAVYFQHYRDQLWGIVDIRDGGFIAEAGLLAALLMGAWKLYKNPPLRKPLGIAMMVGLFAWGAGNLVLHWQERESRLPDLALVELDGKPVNLQAYRGKPLVINLWATWCPPCRREMPALMKAQAEHPQVTFLFVNQGETTDEIQRFMQSQGLELSNVLLDRHNQLGKLAGSMALPTTLYFDSEGRQVGNHLGELSQASLARALKSLQNSEESGQ